MTLIQSTRAIPSDIPGIVGEAEQEALSKRKLRPRDYLALIESYLESRKPYVDRWMNYESIYDHDPSTEAKNMFNPNMMNTGRAYGIIQTGVSSLFNAKPRIFVEPLMGGESEHDLARLF